MPLTPDITHPSPHTAVIRLRDGAGDVIADVTCVYSRAAATGALGELRVRRAGLTARERVRALVLLVREALALADHLGLTRVLTEASAEAVPLARRLAGSDGAEAGGRRLFLAELATVRTHVLTTTTPAGDLTGARDDDAAIEEAARAAVDVRR